MDKLTFRRMLELTYELEGLLEMAVNREEVPEMIPALIRGKIESIQFLAGGEPSGLELAPEEMAAIEEEPPAPLEEDFVQEEPAGESAEETSEESEESIAEEEPHAGKVHEEEAREGETYEAEAHEEDVPEEKACEEHMDEKLEVVVDPSEEVVSEEEVDEKGEEEVAVEDEFASEVGSPRMDMASEAPFAAPEANRPEPKKIKIFSINDRFLYSRELFGGNIAEFEKALKDVAGFESYEEAEEYFYGEYGFDAENPYVADFLIRIAEYFQ